MKVGKMLLLLIFLMSCRAVYPQTVNSSVTIRIDRGKYMVSGVVPSDSIKTEVVEKIKTSLGGSPDFGKLIVQRDAKYFYPGWQAELDKSLPKIKSWKSGVFIFSHNKAEDRKNYPPLPEKIANARILLNDGRTVTVKDYKDTLVVLFFTETWLGPGRPLTTDLNQFYQGVSSRRIEIIAVSTEISSREKKDFRELFKQFNVQYKFGWVDEQMLSDIYDISKLRAIPQTFVILNGRLHGVFTGSSPRVMGLLKELITQTLDENNL